MFISGFKKIREIRVKSSKIGGGISLPHAIWLPALTGVLSLAAFPKLNQGYLAWACFVPLLVFILRCAGARRAFWAGFVAGFIQFFGLIAWIPQVLTRYGNVAEPLCWFLYLLMVGVLACFPGSACAVTRYCMRGLGSWALFLFPAAWVSQEHLRSYAPFGGFPWLLTGYSQTDYLHLVQISDVTGVYGVSFLILTFNSAIVWALLSDTPKSRRMAPLALALLLLGGSALYGERMLRRWGSLKPELTAALLQGNLSFEESERELAWKFRDGYARMAERLEGTKVDLLVLPESPTPLMFQFDTVYAGTLRQLAARYSLGMIFNNVTVSYAGGGERYFNSAYFLSRDGVEVGRYDKVHLVPFGEYVPWKSLFFFVESITKDVGDFQPGSNLTTVRLGDHTANALICFEAIFPYLARQFVRRGSNLIVNLTNDGWYGDSAAPYQHLAMARWRAVENRRYMLRAANSGISAIIEPTGALQVATGLLREDVCVGRFGFVQDQTWYTQHGDVLANVCVIITLVLGAWSAWSLRRAALVECASLLAL